MSLFEDEKQTGVKVKSRLAKAENKGFNRVVFGKSRPCDTASRGRDLT